jgi:PAS domain-containing protein
VKRTLQQTEFFPAGTDAGRGFQKAILRLVKGGAERQAIEAGQVDAIVDPASGNAILLPEAQRAVLDRNEMRQGLLELAYDWTWEQDERYCFVTHTGMADGKFAFGDESIIGRTLWEISIDNLSEGDWQVHRQQVAWHFPFRDLEVRRADRGGEPAYLAISGEPIFDDQHQFKGYRGIARDISARRRAEVREREGNRFFRAAFESLSSPVCVLDSLGNVLRANVPWRVAAPLAGIGAWCGEGTSCLAACDDAQGEERVDGMAIGAGIRQVLAGEREEFRYEYIASSPERRAWFALVARSIVDDAQARAVVSLEDITEGRRAESLLRLQLTVAQGLARSQDASAG